MKSDDIKNILRKASNRPAGVPGIYINLIRILVVVLLFSAVGFSFYIKGVRGRLAAQAESLDEERVKMSVELRGLDAEIERMEELLLYSDRLKIQDLRIKNAAGEVVISGEVKNYGRRGVKDVELTTYFLDEEGAPIHEEKYIAKSHDGQPLYRGQRRRFNFRVNPAPEKATDISLIVTDIQFD